MFERVRRLDALQPQLPEAQLTVAARLHAGQTFPGDESQEIEEVDEINATRRLQYELKQV